jgi:mRNA interferase MazF
VKRGDVIVVALPGDYGKPRPAVVIQSDMVTGTASVLVCPCTTELREPVIFRPLVHPAPETGLRRPSQLMVDKITAVRRDKCGRRIGRLDGEKLIEMNECLALVLGLADAPTA